MILNLFQVFITISIYINNYDDNDGTGRLCKNIIPTPYPNNNPWGTRLPRSKTVKTRAKS